MPASSSKFYLSIQNNSAKLLGCILVLFFAMHLPHISEPPNGYHHWRESQTAAVALNFYAEDMTITEPRVLGREATSGITGMEFPIYNWLAAVIFQATGPSHAVLRFLTLLAGVLGLIFLFVTVHTIFNDTRALFTVWATAFSPLYFFYSGKIIPDIITISASLCGFMGIVKWQTTNRRSWLAIAVVGFTAASVIKPIALAVFLPTAWIMLTGKSESISVRLRRLAVVTVVPLILGALWFFQARSLQAINHIYEFDLQSHIGEIDIGLVPIMIKHFLFQWPWELWIGWPLAPLFFAGLLVSWRESSAKIIWLWIGAAIVAIVAYAAKSSTHDYSTLMIVPPLAIISATGIEKALHNSRITAIMTLVLIVGLPVYAWFRLAHRYGDTGEFQIIRSSTDKIISRDALVAVDDTTPANLLYSLDRKGWSIRDFSASAVVNVARAGAQYLVTPKHLENFEEFGNALRIDSVGVVGTLYCYRLRLDSLPVPTE